MRWLWTGMLPVTAVLLIGCGRGDSGSRDAGAPAASSAVAAKDEGPATGPAKLDDSAYTVMKNGLKYAILKEGEGDGVRDQQVAIRYTGWLPDGTKFDSSPESGETFAFALGHGTAIRGWDEGIQGMRAGERRQLVIPPALGYGAAGDARKKVPPNATLIYDIDLVQIGPAHHHDHEHQEHGGTRGEGR